MRGARAAGCGRRRARAPRLHGAGRWVNLAAVRPPSTAAALVLFGLSACLPEFDPDLDGGSTATAELEGCGLQGRACCVAPNAPCALDLVCSPETQICNRQPVLLCREDAECRPGEVCCSAGLIGTCEAIAKEACPVLDLAVASPALDVITPIESREIDLSRDADRCLLERGCVGGEGLRRLLRVSTRVENVGEADLLLGSPDDTTAPTTSTCGGEPRFSAFLRYELVDSTGPQLRQDMAARCSTPASSQLSLPFDCDYQGLWSGFSQTYGPAPFGSEPAEECEWLDITDLLPGDYTLRVTVNPDGVLPERNRGNNTPVELPIVIPPFADPSAPCPQPANPLLGVGNERECGWGRVAFQAQGQATQCTPSEPFDLVCRANNPQYVCGYYRVCEGTEICGYHDTFARGDSCFFYPEGYMTLTCPATGQFSLWVPVDDPAALDCEPYLYGPVETAPVADAGAPSAP